MKREIGAGKRKRDRSGRERESTTEEERHGGREKDTKRDRGGRERQPQRRRRDRGERKTKRET